MKKFDIISIGSAIRDIFILNKDLKCSGTRVCHPFSPQALGDKISVKRMYFDIGGGGSNTAATFSNMGLKTGLLSRVGNDVAGKEVLKVMKKFKVDTSLVEIDKDEETGYSVIFINKSGDRTILAFRGAADFKTVKKIKPNTLNASWFFITSLNGNLSLLKKIFQVVKKKKIKIAWNPGNTELALGTTKLMPFLKEVDVLLLNRKEARQLTNIHSKNIINIFAGLKKLCPGIIAVTAGQAGAWVMQGKNIYWAKILDKTVVNATGAGDAFGSGFVSGLILYNSDIKKSLQLAMLNSNKVVTKMGAKHGLLKKPPTKKLLSKIKVKKTK